MIRAVTTTATIEAVLNEYVAAIIDPITYEAIWMRRNVQKNVQK